MYRIFIIETILPSSRGYVTNFACGDLHFPHIHAIKQNWGLDEPFYMVTHSEGDAYVAGIAQYLLDKGYNVEKVLHLSADEGDEFKTPTTPLTIQLAYDGDWVTGNKRIDNTDKFGFLDSKHLGWRFKHGTTKGAFIFKYSKELENAELTYWQGEIDGKFSAWYSIREETCRAKFANIDGYRIKQQDEK